MALLAALLFPVFARARENGRRASCQSNLKQRGLALLQGCEDYRGKVPPVNDRLNPETDTWVNRMQPYTRTNQILRCPSQAKDPYGTWGNPGYPPDQVRWPSYGLNFFMALALAGCGAPGDTQSMDKAPPIERRASARADRRARRQKRVARTR